MAFQGLQRAAHQSPAPQPPRRVEEIEVAVVRERRQRPVKRIARRQERQVEDPSVERDHGGAAADPVRDLRQLRPLLAGVAHEELPHFESVVDEPPDADEERVGAGAAAQARGLGVDERRARHVDVGQRRAPRQLGQAPGGCRQRLAQGGAPVRLVGGARMGVHEAPAVGVGGDGAGQHAFDGRRVERGLPTGLGRRGVPWRGAIGRIEPRRSVTARGAGAERRGGIGGIPLLGGAAAPLRPWQPRRSEADAEAGQAGDEFRVGRRCALGWHVGGLWSVF